MWPLYFPVRGHGTKIFRGAEKHDTFLMFNIKNRDIKMDPFGNFLGKNLFRVDAGIECEEKDVVLYLSKINRLSALRTVARVSPQLFNPKGINKVGGFPVTEDIFINAIKYIVNHTDEIGGRTFTPEDFILLIRMCFKLFDKDFGAKLDPFEVMIKISYNQFRYQENPFNILSRSLYLYRKLWTRVDKGNEISVLKEIESIIGIPYDAAIAYCIALVGNKDGYFFPDQKEAIEEISRLLKHKITDIEHNQFLDWISYDYSGIKNHDGLVNPFILRPVINTKCEPEQGKGRLFVVASCSNLFFKISDGIYFPLIDRFNKGGSDNKFKEVFGYVFQEYIGDLLKFYLKTPDVKAEIKYTKNKNKIDSADWFVVYGESMIIIEVKQSSIFLKSKALAKTADIKNDLNKTLTKAAIQLLRTKNDIISGKFPELSEFSSVKTFKLLIVTSDPLYSANSFCKQFIAKEVSLKEDEFDIININELEYLMDNQTDGNSFLDILENKSTNFTNHDFREFLFQLFPKGLGERKFLKKYYEEYFEQLEEQDSNPNPAP
jgi:hypothetical protein